MHTSKSHCLVHQSEQGVETVNNYREFSFWPPVGWLYSLVVQNKVLNSRWVAEQPAACTLPSMLTSLPPTRPPAASTEESQGTEYTEVYQEYTRSSHLSRFLAHAHTVCTRLSFPPTQLIKTGKERLGTRLLLTLLSGYYLLTCIFS